MAGRDWTSLLTGPEKADLAIIGMDWNAFVENYLISFTTQAADKRGISVFGRLKNLNAGQQQAVFAQLSTILTQNGV